LRRKKGRLKQLVSGKGEKKGKINLALYWYRPERKRRGITIGLSIKVAIKSAKLGQQWGGKR